MIFSLRRPVSSRRSFSFLALALIVGGCGAGTAGILGGLSDSGGTTIQTVVEIRLEETERSPATLVLAGKGNENTSIQVEVRYIQGDETESHPATLVPSENPLDLPLSPAGFVKQVGWKWDEDLQTSVLGGTKVRLFVVTVGEDPNAPAGDVLDAVVIDPDNPDNPEAPGVPTVTLVNPPATVDISAPLVLSFQVTDKERDNFGLKIEFAQQDASGNFPPLDSPDCEDTGCDEQGNPSCCWTRIHLLSVSTPPPFVLFNQRADPPNPAIPTTFSVTWDTGTDLAPLAAAGRPIKLRFRPFELVDDGTQIRTGLPGKVAVTETLPVDFVDFAIVPDASRILRDKDHRGRVTIPFALLGDANEAKSVFFQWRRLDDPPFAPLPSNPVAAETLLRSFREKLGVCSEAPPEYTGTITFDVGDFVGLSGLGQENAPLTKSHGGLVGKTLEVLRQPNETEVITDRWPSGVLRRPVAILPLEGKSSILVLDSPVDDTWRLREMVPETGEVLEVIVPTANGNPSAMALELDDPDISVPSPRRILVGSDMAGAWKVERAGNPPELVVTQADNLNPLETGTIRGLVSISHEEAVLTVGNSIVLFNALDNCNGCFNGQAATFVNASVGLREPWGVALDPVDPRSVLVAEHGDRDLSVAGRILRVNLDNQLIYPVPSQGILHPQALAVDPRQSALLVVDAQESGEEQLALLPLRLGTRQAISLDLGLLQAGQIAASSDGTRYIPVPGQDSIVAVGGVRLTRIIEEAVLAGTFLLRSVKVRHASRLEPGTPWRIRDALKPTTPFGGHVFVWDTSKDAPFANSVLLRGVAMSASEVVVSNEFGLSLDSHFLPPAAPTMIDARMDRPTSIAVGDLDGDGDEDLVSANRGSSNITLFLQDEIGFTLSNELALGTPSAPSKVEMADIDLDGDMDIVASEEQAGGGVLVFVQEAPNVFQLIPQGRLELPLQTTTGIVLLDFDHNGLTDIAHAVSSASNCEIHVWTQGTSHAFNDIVLLDGSAFGAFRVSLAVFAGDAKAFSPVSLGQGPHLALGFSAGTNTQLFFNGLCGANSGCGGHSFRICRSEPPFAGAYQEIDVTGGECAFSYASAGVFANRTSCFSIPSCTALTRADVTGDKIKDIIATDPVTGHPTIGVSHDGFVRDSLEALPSPSFLSGIEDVSAADFDGDKQPDVTLAHSITSGVTVLENRSRVVFSNSSHTLTLLPGTCGDITTDSYGGIVGATPCNQAAPGSRIAFWRESSVSGNLLAASTASLDVVEPRAIVSGDFIGFGASEYVVIDGSGGIGGLPVILGFSTVGGFDITTAVSGSGAFNGRFTDLGDPHAACAADMLGNGTLELVVANSSPSGVVVATGSPGGAFSQATPLLTDGIMAGTRDVSAVDWNMDGVMDLVTANTLSNSLSIFVQTSTQVFSPTPVINANIVAPQKVLGADVNQDGFMDLVCTSGDHVTILRGTALGNTTDFDVDVLPTGVGLTDLALGDLNGDALLDVVASAPSSPVLVFQQRPGGTFRPRPSGVINADVFTLSDVSGDGVLDLVGVNNSVSPSVLSIHFGAR